MRKRLKFTDAQLADSIRKPGNSISAISSKEAGARPCLSLPKHMPPPAVAATEPDVTASMQAEAV